jgi:hypothetical protein
MKFEKLLAITTPWEMVYAKFVPIVIVPDVAVAEVTHVKLEVSTQVI